MPLINVSLKHGRDLAEARTSLEKAVNDVQGLFGAMVQRADWSSERNRVRIEGAGFWVEMSVDHEHVHATGDIPFLAGLLGGPLGGGLKKILEDRFQKRLT
jgi:Putative polyhydroxyalkanoic acid system protein (PHA_gran_rgn)